MFIAEPVQGAGGVIVPQDDYFERIREICTQYDVLFVADEVITGFGRTGKLFALDHWGVQPDIVQFAKAITSGYFQFGGIGVSDRISQTLRDAGQAWMHAYTYSAHPVGCAVALRTLQIINDEAFPEQAEIKGRQLLHALREAFADHPYVGDIRGKGLMCAVEFVEDKETKRPFPVGAKIGGRLYAEARRKGLISRVKADNFLLAPPIVISEQQIDQTVQILADSVQTIFD